MIEVDPDVRELLARWAISPDVPVSELTAEAVREDDCGVLALQRTPGALHSVEDVEVIGPAGPLSVRVYRPGPGRLHPVLFLHGGGFVIGREGYDAPLRELARASGCLIVAPECRLAPEHPFPAALQDGLAVARWLNAEAAGLGGSPEPPAVAGDSSGGNLAATITHELTRGGTPPSFQVLIYPMLDATASSVSYQEFATGYGFSSEKSRWYFDQYLPPGIDRRTPRASPLFDRDLGKLPATLVVTAQCDPLRDEGEHHARNLREAGVKVELRRYPRDDPRLLPDDRCPGRITTATPRARRLDANAHRAGTPGEPIVRPPATTGGPEAEPPTGTPHAKGKRLLKGPRTTCPVKIPAEVPHARHQQRPTSAETEQLPAAHPLADGRAGWGHVSGDRG